MSRRNRAALSLAALATFMLASACSSADESTSAAPPDSPASSAGTPSNATSADPLAGEWRTSFTCQESIRAVKRRVGSNWAGWKPENAEAGEPCGDEDGQTELLARFSDGVMALCKPTGVCEVHATYIYPTDSVIRIDDTEGNLCDPGQTCPIDWHFRLSGDELTFRVTKNAWTVSTWEAAPWTRSS